MQYLIWGLLAAVIAAILFSFLSEKRNSAGSVSLPVISEIPAFTLTNQLGQAVSRDDLLGKVWIANIIFTKCAGPCPELTRKMALLQAALPSDSPAALITLTTDPEFDTPAVLKKYGERFGAQSSRWWFLTGAKPEISRLAAGGLKLAAVEKPKEEQTSDVDLFIHSTLFVLVDKKGRLRTTFESTEPGTQQRLLQAVAQLAREK